MAMTKTKNKSTQKKAQRIAVDLQERLDLSQSRVDRESAVIHDVKILGKSSPNKHGMPGVTGTDYLPEAHQQARALYEGIHVNVGHPPRNEPDAERDPKDRNGTLFNVRVQDNQTYGDWQLIPSHPMTQIFLDCAENPKLHSQFAMSHNAKGYGDVREGRYCIREIPVVRSVDVVTLGGVNKSLFESKEHAMKKPFKVLLESATPEVQKRFARLLEMYEDIGDMPMDEPVKEMADEPAGYESHLAEVVKAIMLHDDMTAEEKLDKIKAALKVMEEKAEGGEGGDVAEGDEDAKEGADKKSDDDDAMESRERQELEALRTEKRVRNLCESLEFVPTALQLKALAGLPNDADRKAMVKELQAVQPKAKAGNLPRTATARNVTESRDSGTSAKAKEAFFADILR